MTAWNEEIKTSIQAWEAATEISIANKTEAMFELVTKKDKYRDTLAQLQQLSMKVSQKKRYKKNMSHFMKAFTLILEAQICKVDRRIFFKKSISQLIESKTRAPKEESKKQIFIAAQDKKIQEIENNLNEMEKAAPQISLEELQ
jgi:hypothetical protein